jgi:hypothetical protein
MLSGGHDPFAETVIESDAVQISSRAVSSCPDIRAATARR